MPDLAFTIRPYQPQDRVAVRTIYGMNEFARPQLLQKYPGMNPYLVDSMSHYLDQEPDNTFIAEVETQVVGAEVEAQVLGEEGKGLFQKPFSPIDLF